MPKKLTTEEFIVRGNKIHDCKYDYSKVVYVGIYSAVIVICPIDGEFPQTPNDHLNSGHGCPKCKARAASLRFISNAGEFILKANKVHENKYDYGKVDYINSLTDVIIICPIDGEFTQTPNNHIAGKGCPKCGGTKKLTTAEYISKARKVHGNYYDYSKVDYINYFRKVINICPTHGEFPQIPAAHLSGAGCPKCSRNKKLTTEEFIVSARKVHGNYYDYSKVDYINSWTKVIIICPIHGEFWQKPNNHINIGQGCPICQSSHGELYIAKFLEKNNIKYIRQKTFKDCRNPQTNYKLSFDFCLMEYNMLIEFNGEQHYRFRNYWNKDKNTFKDQQYRDEIKKEYAISNGYKYLVIKYTNNIEEKLKESLSEAKIIRG